MNAVLVACGDGVSPGDGLTEGAPIGVVEVTIATGGDDVDEDGYRLVIDSRNNRAVAPNVVVRIERMTLGTHEITLTGVAENCSVAGGGRQTVTIGGVDPVPVSFTIDCEATGILVTIAERGGDLDLTGYTVYVDGVQSRYLAGSDAATIGRMRAGSHLVALGDVASNCAVLGENPRTVTTPASGLLSVEFVVQCVAFSGTVEVDITSVGVDLDTDGYVLRIDGAIDRTVMPSQTLRFDRVAAGSRSVQLVKMTSNCTAANNPRAVMVTLGDTVRVDFHVSCVYAEKIAFSETNGINSWIVVMHADGSDARTVLFGGTEPSWSPDGKRFLFAAISCEPYYYYYYYSCFYSGLGVADSDGRNVRQLTSGYDLAPAWSPDSTVIAFARFERGQGRILVLNTDTGLTTEVPLPGIVSEGTEPVWSPDGTRLAFSCSIDGSSDICLVNRDGSGFAQLTTGPYFDQAPSWSPDGTRLAFSRNQEPDDLRIAVMNADGTGLTLLAQGIDPAWSRDGTRIVFAKPPSLGSGLFIMNADGTGVSNLTTGTARAPAWRP
jgi:TolB protein